MKQLYKTGAILLYLGISLGAYQESRGQQVLAIHTLGANSLIEELALANTHPVLVELLAQSGLGSLLSTAGPYTLFVPSEESCKTMRAQRPERIRAVLAAHIVEGKYEAHDLREGTRLRSLTGETLLVLRKKDALFLNGVRLVPRDMAARNGVWHQLDNLLMPKSLH